jgi:hypothetical protein
MATNASPFREEMAMRARLSFFLWIAVVGLIFSGCSDDSSTPTPDGKVTTKDGGADGPAGKLDGPTVQKDQGPLQDRGPAQDGPTQDGPAQDGPAGKQDTGMNPDSQAPKPDTGGGPNPLPPNAKIIFLHHSTGGVVWGGGVRNAINQHNKAHSKSYQITEQDFPKSSPYGWENYPYDYWNIWVNHAGPSRYMQEPTLEILTKQYDVIIWKHCFPVSYVGADSGNPNVSSSDKTAENYKLQYNALRQKMLQFPNTRFIVWTGAALVQNETNQAEATRAKDFFEWVKNSWDKKGDNIFIWDFRQLETDGGLYLKNAYAADPWDSHPNSSFASRVAPFFAKRICDVIEGRGDSTSLTGQ